MTPTGLISWIDSERRGVEHNDQVYIKLKKHIDNQAVGSPVTKSGVEIKILKHIFKYEEAEIASFLSYKFEPLKIGFGRMGHLVGSPEELEKILDGIQIQLFKEKIEVTGLPIFNFG